MARGGQEAKQAPTPIGPFSGGLNQLEDARLIGDDQLVTVQNFDIGRSGELNIRPGLRRVGAVSSNIRVVGTALLSTNVTRAFYRTPATQVVSYADGTAVTSGTSWTAIGSTVAGATEKLVQYNDRAIPPNPSVWLVPKDVQPGGSTPAQGVSFTLNTNTATTVASMPRGSGAVVFKDRMFIFGPVDANNTATQRIYYSTSTDFTSWPASNFFDINPGDGEGVTAAHTSQDTIVFFKRHSTYVLFYDTDPGLGVLRKVNSQIGVTGPDSVQQFENALYVIDERTIYRVQNLLFTDIGKNLNLKSRRQTVSFGGSNNDFVHIFGNRIMFIIYTGRTTPYEYYIYHTEVDAWTQYAFDEQPERFYRVVSGTNFEDDIASKTGSPNLYVFSPFRTDAPAYGDYPASTTNVMLRTKKYNLGNPSIYKRLFWWGMDAAFPTGNIQLTAIADGVNSSSVATIASTGSTSPVFIRGFIPTRGRYLEFLLNNFTGATLTILPGIAYITSHAGVDNPSNV